MQAWNNSSHEIVSQDPQQAVPTSQIENDLEFKAHVYQQLVELQPYLSPDSQVAVLIQPGDEDEEGDGSVYSLSLVATFGEYKLESLGRADNIYEAFGLAKQNMLGQLDEYYNAAIDSTERDAQIQGLIEGTHTLH